jgi:uncharacterized protein
MDERVRIAVRPYASALPLGFFAFGIGMLLLGGLGNGWLHPSDRHQVGLVLVAFVGPLELICAVFAFLARDTFGATGLGLFAGSWFANGFANLMASQDSLSRTAGLFDVGFAFVIVFVAAAAFAGKPLIGVIMSVSAVRAALAGVEQLGGPHWPTTVAGWIGVALFFLGVYGGLAFLLEDAQKRAVLPVFRTGASKEALEGGLAAQLAALADEPGVRHSL